MNNNKEQALLDEERHQQINDEDAMALSEDWWAVGNDLRFAMGMPPEHRKDTDD